MSVTNSSQKISESILGQKEEIKSYFQNLILVPMLTENHSTKGFHCKKTSDFILFYNLIFDRETNFPNIFESIRVDSQLHVQLQYNGNPVPLPPWFVEERNAKLTRISMLENFPSYMRNVASAGNGDFCILEELEKRKHYRAKGRPLLLSGMRYFYDTHQHKHISYS